MPYYPEKRPEISGNEKERNKKDSEKAGNGNRHEVAVVVNTENQNNVSRKKVGQKLVTRQNENPEHVAGKAVSGFWTSFPFY